MTRQQLTFPDLPAEEVTAPVGPIRIGSDDRKKLFCHTLLSIFDAYKPAVIDWSKLAPDALARLTRFMRKSAHA
jgi:hypothetical protein